MIRDRQRDEKSDNKVNEAIDEESKMKKWGGLKMYQAKSVQN